MILIFMDESGYSHDWEADVENQPYYVVSGVCIPAEVYPIACQNIRTDIENLNLPGASEPLGQGFEIRARDIAGGAGWWQRHNEERNFVRDLMLSFPAKNSATAFVVVIDKKSHRERYVVPENPYMLSLQFIFERLQWYLSDIDDYGYCIYDQNCIEGALQNHSTALMRDGSWISLLNNPHNNIIAYKLNIDRIVGLSFGRSDNSIGIQIADFFTTMTYFYYRDGEPSPCGWWDTLISSLHKKDDKLEGIGLKEFPK